MWPFKPSNRIGLDRSHLFLPGSTKAWAVSVFINNPKGSPPHQAIGPKDQAQWIANNLGSPN